MNHVKCPNCNATIHKVVSIDRRKLLIVEGVDEEQFFKALLKHLAIDDIQVLGIAGKDRLGQRLKGLKKDRLWPTVHSVGILRDANGDPKAAFRSVCSALKAAGLPIPKRVLTQAEAKGQPTIMVMIIPSASKKGALEDLCLNSVMNDSATTCVEQYFQCIVERGASGPKKGALSKAKTRVFLTSKEDPTLPLGIAAQRGYWPLDSDVFDELKRFITAV